MTALSITNQKIKTIKKITGMERMNITFNTGM